MYGYSREKLHINHFLELKGCDDLLIDELKAQKWYSLILIDKLKFYQFMFYLFLLFINSLSLTSAGISIEINVIYSLFSFKYIQSIYDFLDELYG